MQKNILRSLILWLIASTAFAASAPFPSSSIDLLSADTEKMIYAVLRANRVAEWNPTPWNREPADKAEIIANWLHKMLSEYGRHEVILLNPDPKDKEPLPSLPPVSTLTWRTTGECVSIRAEYEGQVRMWRIMMMAGIRAHCIKQIVELKKVSIEKIEKESQTPKTPQTFESMLAKTSGKIGYWKSAKSIDLDENGGLPFPQENSATPTFNANEFYRRLELVEFELAKTMWPQQGDACCRLCKLKRSLGCRDMMRDGWVWPEGYGHYAKEHRVAVPPSFVAAVYEWTTGK